MNEAIYGFCPICGNQGVAREYAHDTRESKDACLKGHVYLSKDARDRPVFPAQERPTEEGQSKSLAKQLWDQIFEAAGIPPAGTIDPRQLQVYSHKVYCDYIETLEERIKALEEKREMKDPASNDTQMHIFHYCSYCGVRFKYVSQLTNHLMHDHREAYEARLKSNKED